MSVDMELRCDHKMHGELKDGLLVVKCGSDLCGRAPGVVVLHKWDVETGKLVETQKFKDTPIINRNKEK